MPLPPQPGADARPPAVAPPSGSPRSVVVLTGVAAAVVVAGGLWLASEIVAPAALALMLTIAVLPVDRRMRRRGRPGALATLTALVAAYAILLVLAVGTVVCLLQLLRVLPRYAGAAAELADGARTGLSALGLDSAATAEASAGLDLDRLLGWLDTVLAAVLGSLGVMFLLVTLMFFFVTAVHGFGPRVAELARSKPALAAALVGFVGSTQRYLVVTAAFGAVVAVLDTGALWLLGVPLPLVWGLFSFLTNFIPTVGFVIGVIPPALLALLEHGPGRMLAVVVIYTVLNVSIQTFVQPRVIGATVGLSTEMTFLSLVVWSFLLGPLGAVLAVPMTLLFRAVFVDADPGTAWVRPLIGTTAGPQSVAPPVPVAPVAPVETPAGQPDPDPAGR